MANDPYTDFDPVMHGIEEGLAYLNEKLDEVTGTLDDPIDADMESARDNLATALSFYKSAVAPVSRIDEDADGMEYIT